MKRGLFVAAFLLAFAARTAWGQTLEVTPAKALVDETVTILAKGLQPNEHISIQAELTDGASAAWTSEGEFIADVQGVVDTSKQAPVKGSYKEIFAMGLVLFMKPTAKGVEAYTAPKDFGSQLILFHLMRNGQTAASAQLEQEHLGDGVRQIKVEGELKGILFLPNASGRVPGVLVVGGSEGGAPAAKAAWLASHGYAALALAYFHYEDLPKDIAGIPLEYFGAALVWMSQRPEILADQIGVLGSSRGGELALQLGAMFPQIKAVVAYVPANVRYPACCGGTSVPYAWTWRGHPLSYIDARLANNPFSDPTRMLDATIPVERTQGPILLISGGDDHVWDSTRMADEVAARLKNAHFAYRVENLKYAHAGHLVGRPALVPAWIGRGVHTASGAELDLGGSVAGGVEASLDAIPKVLEFLGESLQETPPKQ